MKLFDQHNQPQGDNQETFNSEIDSVVSVESEMDILNADHQDFNDSIAMVDGAIAVAAGIEAAVATESDIMAAGQVNAGVAQLVLGAHLQFAEKLGIESDIAGVSTESVEANPTQVVAMSIEEKSEIFTKIMDKVKEIWAKLVAKLRAIGLKIIMAVGNYEKQVASLVEKKKTLSISVKDGMEEYSEDELLGLAGVNYLLAKAAISGGANEAGAFAKALVDVKMNTASISTLAGSLKSFDSKTGDELKKALKDAKATATAVFEGLKDASGTAKDFEGLDAVVNEVNGMAGDTGTLTIPFGCSGKTCKAVIFYGAKQTLPGGAGETVALRTRAVVSKASDTAVGNFAKSKVKVYTPTDIDVVLAAAGVMAKSVKTFKGELDKAVKDGDDVVKSSVIDTKGFSGFDGLDEAGKSALANKVGNISGSSINAFSTETARFAVETMFAYLSTMKGLMSLANKSMAHYAPSAAK